MMHQTDPTPTEEQDDTAPSWRVWADWFRPKAAPFVIGIVAALLAVALVIATRTAPEPQLTNEQIDTLVAEALASATPPPPASAIAYQIILPSLAIIQTEGVDDGDFGIGTGVIINEDGSILTSLHVVAGAEQIKVSFADGTSTEAIIAAEQPENDIAVLQLAQLPSQFLPATLAGIPPVGEEVFAVGNPLGLVGSMSSGVVSGLDRSFQPQESEFELTGMIQFDAAVNPGNSGGPLLNRAGQVVGIVTGLVNPSGNDVFIGIGFAVPIGTAAGGAGGPQQ